MEEKILNTILLEFRKLHKRLDNIEDENKIKFNKIDEKFSLIDARFNTLEELVLSMQNDIMSLKRK